MSAGPDLGAIFDEHVASEFEAKDIDATMRTMVKDPYVWHVPVLTGASGGEEVRRFYSTRFIGHTPADAVLRRISRTVSADRVIDEFVLEFTHDVEIPFMLPGVAPTGTTGACAHGRRDGVRGRQGPLRAHLLGSGHAAPSVWASSTPPPPAAFARRSPCSR
jgi:hypothetical protein